MKLVSMKRAFGAGRQYLASCFGTGTTPDMARRAIGVGICAAIAFAFVPATPILAQDVKVAKLGHGFADTHPRSAAMKYFAEEVAKATGGSVKIDVFGNSAIGSEEKMLMALQSGTIDLYMGALAPIATHEKELQIFDVPFLFSTDAEAADVLDSPQGKRLLDNLADMNIHGLVWAGGAFRNLSNSKHPVASLTDMKGLKVRVMQSPMALASFKALGMNAVPMAFTEVYTALETRALDGYEHPFVDMYANKMFEVQKYLTVTNHVYTPVALLSSKRFYDSLTAEQQNAVQAAAEKTRTFQREAELRDASEALKKLEAEGMKATVMQPAELDAVRKAIEPVVAKNRDVIGNEFVDQFYAEIAKYRK
ncbi:MULTISPECIES: DctP family TRAP transporter solute-binding subunit [unclassified Rhizobium]|uniref:DctP family TRAP transporter solute-binding subunit n=1 Tax=unclassified Rhizobium TaxID=2613769 RepID=UPI002478B0B3|nr:MULTISPECIES: DctP family TRAP transporter solute-binding subunit [unclassified Rhizobium]MDH7803237.1 tripartite ATP-independent transporter DctP family solute receptor [Rhizobium sp. AN70]